MKKSLPSVPCSLLSNIITLTDYNRSWCEVKFGSTLLFSTHTFLTNLHELSFFPYDNRSTMLLPSLILHAHNEWSPVSASHVIRAAVVRTATSSTRACNYVMLISMGGDKVVCNAISYALASSHALASGEDNT